jgi:P27 family predicted phage terminase small subunit
VTRQLRSVPAHTARAAAQGSVLPPPSWLSPEAQDIWRTLAPLVPAGRLTEATADLFAMYAVSLATYREADGLVQEAGILIAAGQDLAPNPALPIRGQADQTAARWARTFGLSPDTAPANQPRRKLPHLVEGQ